MGALHVWPQLQARSLASQLAQVSRHILKAVFCCPFKSLPTLLGSPAIIELDAAMRSAQLRHDGNPVLTWCIGNVVGKADDRRKLLAAIARLSIEMHAAVTASSRETSEPAASTAERRRLTVMFCGLVGWTALSARLDPEGLSRLIRRYQACAPTIIARFEHEQGCVGAIRLTRSRAFLAAIDAGAILIRGRPQPPVAGLDSITLEWLRSGSRSHEGGSSREIWPVL